MRRALAATLLAPLLALGLTAGPALGTTTGTSNTPVSAQGVTPTSYAGNFVADNDQQVCYAMERLGLIGEVTTDMRGYKIDSSTPYSDGFVDVTISPDGRLLHWASTNATVHAFIVKGGTNYNHYDYSRRTQVLTADQGLGSPGTAKKRPQVSHYNVCYTPDVTPPVNGCTPGYWRNHADRWLGAATSDSFNSTFSVNSASSTLLDTYTLGQGIQANGGGIHALARHGTAALLNSYGGVPNSSDGTTVAYPYSTSEVIAMVQASIADGTFAHEVLAAANELGCPLSGTKAKAVG